MSASDASLPVNTDLIVPLSVDGGIWVDGVQMPITVNSAVAIPLNAIITIRHRGATVGVRLLHSDKYDDSSAAPPVVPPPVVPPPTPPPSVNGTNTTAAPPPIATLPPTNTIWDATVPTPLVWSSLLEPGVGKQQYSLTWQVDSDSLHAGVGRFTLHHKNRGDSAFRSYRTAWLWLGGDTPSTEAVSLATALRTAVVSETITDAAGWDAANQPLSCSGSCAAQRSRWQLSATIDTVTLAVDRTDVYDAHGNLASYQQPETGAPFLAPFYVDSATLSRTVNGRQMQQWSAGEIPFRINRIQTANVFKPY